MPKSIQGAPAPARTTAFTKFFSCNPQQDALFAVNADIALDDALETASAMLDAAKQAVQALAQESDTGTAWGALYLVDMAKAVVNSAILANGREGREDDAPESATGSLEYAGEMLAAALEDLLRQVENGNGPEIVTGRAIRALATWQETKGGAQ